MLIVATRNSLLTHFGGLATHLSLHTAQPDDSGSNEVSGGDYARQSLTWGTAASAQIALSNQPQFDVPASTTVTHLGYWSASSGGTFRGWRPIAEAEVFGSAGQLTVTALTEDMLRPEDLE